jgi:hypothetical protein
MNILPEMNSGLAYSAATAADVGSTVQAASEIDARHPRARPRDLFD